MERGTRAGIPAVLSFGGLEHMRVLIVDDSQLMRKVLIGALKRMGINDIIEATNGIEALEKVAINSDIGLVMMDSRMPVMGGLHAIKKMRADGYKLPIIMVSTEGEKAKVLEAIRAGANDYLIKPFNPRDIQAKLEKYLVNNSA